MHGKRRKRRNVARYLQKRGLACPSIPWDEINAVRDEVFATSAIKNKKLTADKLTALSPLH